MNVNASAPCRDVILFFFFFVVVVVDFFSCQYCW